MKKIFACLLALMLVLGCTAVAEEAKPLAGKTLKIAMSPDFMYFETISETDPCGYEGLDIDIIKSLSEKLGFEWEIVPMSFSSLIGSLQTGNADFVISGMSYTEERAQVVDFSMTYVTTDVGCVVPVASEIDSYDDLKGQIVCCSQGTTYEMLIEGIEGATLKTYQGQAAVGAAAAGACCQKRRTCADFPCAEKAAYTGLCGGFAAGAALYGMDDEPVVCFHVCIHGAGVYAAAVCSGAFGHPAP